MNCKNLILLTAVCSMLFVGCRQKSNSSEGVVTVDFHDYMEKSVSEIADKLYSSKRYVVLHADDQNLMTGQVGKIVLYGNKIVVCEQNMGLNSDQKLVVHDASGRAVAKIGNKGRGPGEYMQITDFDVDDAGRVHLMDGTLGNKKILIYDTDGRFVEELSLPFSVDLVKCSPDGGYLFAISSWDSSEYAGRKFVKTDADLNVENVAGEYDMSQIDNNFILGGGSLVETPEGLFYQRSPDENVYMLDGKGNIEKTWFLDLGNRAIPADKRSNIGALYDSGEIEEYSWFDFFVVPWDKYIFGTMSDRGNFKSFVYDTQAQINYTQAGTAGDFGVAIAISDGYLITVFPYDGENFSSDLPEGLRAEVSAGDPLICLYELK